MKYTGSSNNRTIPVSDPSSTDKRRQRGPAYLSQTKFAEHVDVSRVTVWRWRRDGKLRTVQLTPTITRIPLSEVERMSRETAGKGPSPRKRRKHLGAEQRDDEDDPPEEPD